MLSVVLQSLTSMLLAGFLVYLVFKSDQLRNRIRVQQTLLGVVFGVMVISFSMNPLELEHSVATFDAKAGPLIFAGFLGGPIGALIAGLCGSVYLFSFGGSSPVLATFMNFAIPVTGLGVSYLQPAQKWPLTHKSSVGYLLVGFALLHLVSLWYLNKFDENGVLSTALIVAGIVVVGFLSILVLWQILNFAVHTANVARQATELAQGLELAMRTSGIGMFVHKAGDPGPHYDAQLIELFGLDREPGIIPVPDWEPLFHPDDLRRIRSEMQQAWSGGKTQGKSEIRAFRTDGKQLNIHVAWAAELDANNAVKRITGMIADMTESREAEQRQQESNERLALIVENLPGVVFENVSTDGEVPDLSFITPKCKDLWGYSVEEFFADPTLFRQMHDPEDLPVFLKALERSLETGEPVHHRYQITARDGQSRWLDYHGSTSVEDGRVRVKGIVLDATREVQFQQQIEKEREIARRAQRHESIGQLTGGVAHDFNNLLAVILGNLELLRDGDEPSMQKDMIDAAITAALRGADLTRNMLAFSRQAPLTPVVLDLNKIIREAKNWIARALPESVRVETSLLAGLWPVEADRASLESALLNLTLNARDAMEGHGNLTIETANVRIDDAYIDSRQEEIAPGRYVMLAVSDTGPGISEEIIGSIFDPFFTTKPPGIGSGLGLSMTVGFMRQSGGTVQVYTEIGEGTTFKLYFPAAKEPNGQHKEPLPIGNSVPGDGLRLLLAEDEDAVRELLVTVLERAGYLVTAASSGDAAFAKFQANPHFDLLLTDIVMPGELQGTTLAKALREQWPDLPVLFMSGYASEATVHGNGLRPEDIRLMKPVQRAELLAAVGKVAAALKE